MATWGKRTSRLISKRGLLLVATDVDATGVENLAAMLKVEAAHHITMNIKDGN